MTKKLVIYNTRSQTKEEFQTLEPGIVKLYLCGPTVYGFLHVGNFRGPIFFNLVRNWLEHLQYKVNFIFNYTDVDDKIIDRAKVENLSALEISEKYIAEFQKDFSALKLKNHSQNPKVTEFIPSIVELIQILIERGHAYVIDTGEVLYSVRKFSDYGKLSHRNIDDLQNGIRVEMNSKKQDPLDFALWKPAKPGEPKWSSPWGDGRPGWHIECSAMIKALLGDSIDIHGGGLDLLFPHHENELAQSEGATAKPFVKYWMHNNMLTFGDRKMSKSVGNIKAAREFMNEYNPEILKYMMLSAHYRSLLDFSDKAIDMSVSGLARIYSSLALAQGLLDMNDNQAIVPTPHVPAKFGNALEQENENFAASLNDDFNTPEAMAAIFNIVRAFNASVRHGQKLTPELKALVIRFQAWVAEKGELMSLFLEPPAEFLHTVDDMLLGKLNVVRSDVDKIVVERSAARVAKDFAKSDELRKKLTELGISVQDFATGSSWEVTK
jgi:cysteinyl-tRNA synthetase